MKFSRILGVILVAVTSSPVCAQDCANLDGVWSAREDAAVITCLGGNCVALPQSATLPLQVVQDSCSVSLSSLGVNPFTGQILMLPRSGSVSCGAVNFSGALAPFLPGVTYATNWIRCSGTLADGRLVVRCAGTASGSGQGRSFVVNLASTGTWSGGPAQPMPEIFRDPADRIAGLGSNVTLNVIAVGPCLKFQWQHAGTNLPAATNAALTLRRVRALDAGGYSVVVSNFAGVVTSQVAQVVVSDLTPPVPAFLASTPGQRVTTERIHVAGTATDNVGAERVELSVNDGPFQLAGGTSRWTAEATLVPGTNRLSVRAADAAGNLSAPVSRAVFYSVPAPLIVTTDGPGSVQPNLNGRMLEIGRAYTMTAVPSNGWISAGWTGGAETNRATVRFLMASDLALTTHFVTNPFPPLAGLYRGLFSEYPDARPQSGGVLSLTLGKSGTFSGALRIGGLVRSFTGRFDATGRARVTVASSVNPWVLDLALALDDADHRLTGTVSRADWTASLLAESAVFDARSNPSPFARRHTFVVKGATDPALVAAGDGYGSVTTTRGGSVTMAGRLADNSVLTLTSPLLRDGWWPVYQSLYAGKGCFLGWVQFNNDSAGGFSGQAHWIRPANPHATWYRGGFTNVSDVTGFAYVAPTGNGRVLAMESGVAVFSGGSLSSAFVNRFDLSARGTSTNLSTNAMSLVIQRGTGLFTGSVRPPGSNRRVSFSGAVLQGENTGRGYFPGNVGSGGVRLYDAR